MTQGAYIWLGALFLLTVSLLVVDAGTAVVRLGVAPGSTELEIARVAAATAAGLAALVTAIALRNGIGPVAVRRVPVELPGWPDELAGFKILQLSDVHIGPILKAAWLARVVARVNAERPDLVVITGDLVDGPVARLAGDVAPLAALQATHGVFFVTGNHEFYSGVEAWLAHLPTLGIEVLGGRRVAIDANGAGFDLLGIHDHSAHRFGSHYAVEVADLVAGRDPSRPLIALAHQPVSARALEGHGVALQLSGHTHGGQLWPFTALVRLDQRYVAGLYDHDDTMRIYVSRGTGFWGPPMRLFAPAEITALVVSRRPPR